MEEKPQYLKITSDVERMIQRRRDKVTPPRSSEETEGSVGWHHNVSAGLNETQGKVLATIIRRTNDTGKPPTYSEVTEALGIAKVTVRKVVDVLEDRGYVVRCTFYPLRDVDGFPLK